jgi:hypothetical protein
VATSIADRPISVPEIAVSLDQDGFANVWAVVLSNS